MVSLHPLDTSLGSAKSQGALLCERYRMEIGAKVGAVLSAVDGVVHFLGWEVYGGDVIPEDRGPGYVATSLHNAKLRNPKIILENGKVVYGCECWWGKEKAIQVAIDRWRREGYKIVNADIHGALEMRGQDGNTSST